MNQEKIKALEEHAKTLRKLTIEMIGELGVGHIGGCLSICDVLSVLYFDVMAIDPKHPRWQERDRFILSKGHGGPALYAALAHKGYFDKDLLHTLNRSNTNLPSHCDMIRTTGIDMTAGSLGQGFSAAIGMALGARMDHHSCYIYTLIGDGESQEGQIWEAAMLAGSKKLDHVIAFTDYNQMQIDGYTHDINSLEPMDKKWEAFGWHVQVIDGHNIPEIINAIEKAKDQQEKPSMIILKTIKGKGAYFAEGKVGSHNMPVSEEEWKKAIAMLDEKEVV
ncbi:transketolase [Vallitalea pronyensis]|uniref:Transketolase n=1 Tax=Vallitalea pronyensis TaxID=1348613 RepID=A0A8J8SHQ6_9FIRM|nr:transketolase [Vallitalea pronyensis]QUI23682.1 transketolase [Vallitalea pronyensis]